MFLLTYQLKKRILILKYLFTQVKTTDYRMVQHPLEDDLASSGKVIVLPE